MLISLNNLKMLSTVHEITTPCKYVVYFGQHYLTASTTIAMEQVRGINYSCGKLSTYHPCNWELNIVQQLLD